MLWYNSSATRDYAIFNKIWFVFCRKESPDDDAEAASEYSAQLVDAARNGMLFGDGHIFRDCITTKSASTLKLILEMFLKVFPAGFL